MLHSWSNQYAQHIGIPYARWARRHGSGMIAPDFRGVNNKPQATGSNQAVQDVVDAIDFAIRRGGIDTDRVFTVGFSGGGMMSLLVAGRHPRRIAGAVSWVPVHDLVDWYDYNASQVPRRDYANHIEASCRGNPTADEDARRRCRHRSPSGHPRLAPRRHRGCGAQVAGADGDDRGYAPSAVPHSPDGPALTGRGLLALGLALLVSGCSSATRPAPAADLHGCAGSRLQPSAANRLAMHAATLCLLNAERRRHGLAELTEDPALQQAAQRHSSDMAARDFFEHDSPEGIKPWIRIARTGYRAGIVGENLAWGESDKGSPASALQLWLESPGHRRNMLDPRYTQVGIGVVIGSPSSEPTRRAAAIYTTTFGSAAVATR